VNGWTVIRVIVPPLRRGNSCVRNRLELLGLLDSLVETLEVSWTKRLLGANVPGLGESLRAFSVIGLLAQPAFLDLLASFDFLTTFRAIDHIDHEFVEGC